MQFLKQTAAIFLVTLVIASCVAGGFVLMSDRDPNHKLVMAWFKENLNDPKSLEIVSWSHPEKNGKDEIVLAVKYRANNAMGALILSESVFRISKGKVQSVVDAKDFHLADP